MQSTFVTILSLIALASCSTTHHLSQKAGKLDVSVKGNLQAEVEVDMQKKIVGKSHYSRLFGLIDLNGSKNYADGVTYDGEGGGFLFFGGGVVEDAKSAAAYNATVPNKADILVAPQYLVKVNSWFFGAYKEVTAQVWGYAGKIKNIKTKEWSHPVEAK